MQRRGEIPGQERHLHKTARASDAPPSSGALLHINEGRLIDMKQAELKELYTMVFPEYPDIVTV
ncbi:MAG: hypothetical protein EOM14_06885, partial [Clostridia bacterium]|nr:hypothetical protein [Clostridia bacterium]